MAAKLTYLYDLSTIISSGLNISQIVSTMIFGSSDISIGMYDGTHIYNRGNLVIWVDDYSVIHVMQCLTDGATGHTLDPMDWTEFSILNAICNTANNLIILSALRPTEEGNCVWLQFRGGGSGIPDDNYGLIIKKNFVISPYEPTDFGTDIVWGKVQTN